MSARLTSVAADCDRCFVDDAGDFVVLVTEWDRESSLGVVMGESGVIWGKVGSQLDQSGYFLVVVGEGLFELVVLLEFFLPLMLWQGGCLGMCFCFLGWFFYMLFLSFLS